jgi:hypothetical protein
VVRRARPRPPPAPDARARVSLSARDPDALRSRAALGARERVSAEPEFDGMAIGVAHDHHYAQFWIGSAATAPQMAQGQVPRK